MLKHLQDDRIPLRENQHHLEPIPWPDKKYATCGRNPTTRAMSVLHFIVKRQVIDYVKFLR